MTKEETYKYRAFISYSHMDEKFARRLHKKIENYKIPKSLREKYPNLPKDLNRSIFLDDEELKATGDLPDQLITNLKNSRILILVCSPYAVGVHKKEGEKNWVDEEIIAFKYYRGEGNILAIIKEGEPNATYSSLYDDKLEAFPKALRYEIYKDKQLTNIRAKDPIAADARSPKPWEKRKAFIRLIAGILSVDFADLWERDKIEQRIRLAFTGVLVALFIALSIYASTQFVTEKTNQQLKAITTNISKIEYTILHNSNLTQQEIIDLNNQLKKLKQDRKNLKDRLAWMNKADTPLLQKAKNLKTDEALALLTSQEAKANRENRRKKSSKELIAIAKLYVEKYNYQKANSYYKEAIDEYFDYDNTLAYANFLDDQNVFNTAVNLYKKLQKHNLTKEQHSAVLNNLANLQYKLNQNQDALKNYNEALQIRRELAKNNPSVYNPYVATTLNNLAALQEKLNQNQEALKNYGEALKLYRELAKNNPSAYNPDVAMTLNNLAILQKKLNQNQEALKNYGEALQIRKELIKTYPQVFGLYYVKTILTGAYYLDIKHPKDRLKEAKEILQKYFKGVPKAEELLKMIDELEKQH